MKKFVVILLVLLLGLLGVEGCAPDMEGLRPEGISTEEEIVKVRGLTVEFEEDKPLLTFVGGERLPVIWTGDEVNVGLRIDNYLLKKIKANVKVFSLATGVYGGKIIQGEDSLILESANLEGNEISPSINTIEFGPYFYNKERVGEHLEDSLITKIDLDYKGLITADLCFTREKIKECDNYRTFTENDFKGDAGYLPVSISEIIKQATVKNNVATVRLFIKFNNFGNGYIQNNRLKKFSAKVGNVGLQCDDWVVFENNKADVLCRGNIPLSGTYIYLPAVFEFDYGYEVKGSINYKVISE